jgi:hypothetical protein
MAMRNHPVSAAAAGGSLDAVKWLTEHDADPCEEDRTSIVKEYAQTPIVITAHHGHVHILRYLSGIGILSQPVRAWWDHLSRAIFLLY